MKILKTRGPLTLEQHEQIGLHFSAIRAHLVEIQRLLTGRLRARALDGLIRVIDGGDFLGTLRRALQERLVDDHGAHSFYTRDVECTGSVSKTEAVRKSD